MNKLIPPKRRVRKDGIPLNERENERFLSFVRERGFDRLVEVFLVETGLYLRGRCDGSGGSGTDPCGYVFVSRDSFEKGHAAILFFDPMPKNTPLNISFRRWKGILPFGENDWDSLERDRLQENMRVLELTSDNKLRRAIELTRKACNVFDESFDLTINLV